MRSSAAHLPEIDPRASCEHCSGNAYLRTVKTICIGFEGTEYRQMSCAYLKGRSTGQMCAYLKGQSTWQMCAYLKGLSTGRCCVRI